MQKLVEDYTNKIEIKKSKFITILHRTNDEEEAKEFLKQVKKEHPNANHHCSAMIIGNVVRSSDDREPSGTAGRPMLDCLLGREMEDILAIVVRYFGGVKLGTGGLVRAYGSSVSQALDQARLCQVKRLQVYSLEFGYEWIGKIDALLRNHNIEITLKNYEETVQYQYITSLDISEEIKEISAGSIVPVYLHDTEMEVEIERKE